MAVIEVTISEQSVQILDKLVLLGIYGVDRDEIAARFIDEMLSQFMEPPRFDGFDGAGWIREIIESKVKPPTE